jgi:AcrR family transcriptional regulator
MVSRTRTAHRVDPRGDERHNAFLEAATHVFLSRGFEKATLAEVIARSGGSRATLYARFGSKEGLFAAIIEAKCGQIVAALESGRMDGGLAEVLREFATAYMRELMSVESLALYRLVIGESGRFPKLGAAVFKAGPNAAAERLAAYLRESAEAGIVEFPDTNIDLAARQFLEMVKGDLHLRALMWTSQTPTRKAVTRCIDLAVSVFLNGILGEQGLFLTEPGH